MAGDCIKRFLSDTRGAVSVDWVVITALLTATGIAMVDIITAEMVDLNHDLRAEFLEDYTQRSFADVLPPPPDGGDGS